MQSSTNYKPTYILFLFHEIRLVCYWKSTTILNAGNFCRWIYFAHANFPKYCPKYTQDNLLLNDKKASRKQHVVGEHESSNGLQESHQDMTPKKQQPNIM